VRVHQSFTITGDASRELGHAAANQPQSIRSKNRLWRATMSCEAGEHENFFIAKIRDSESAQRVFERF
jgi:hypothetical protein